MHSITPEHEIKSILQRTIELPTTFVDTYQLYSVSNEDRDFVRALFGKEHNDENDTLDAFIKLFIAFYFESIPNQIIFNLKHLPPTFVKGERATEYFLSVAGLLHEVKTFLNEQSEMFVPYLTAYEEFAKGTLHDNVTEGQLLKRFGENIENAIQQVITA